MLQLKLNYIFKLIGVRAKEKNYQAEIKGDRPSSHFANTDYTGKGDGFSGICNSGHLPFLSCFDRVTARGESMLCTGQGAKETDSKCVCVCICKNGVLLNLLEGAVPM